MNHGMRKLIAARAERYYATDAQKTYMHRLLNEAFAHLYPTVYDVNHLERVTRAEASQAIGELIEAKKAGWPRRK